MKERFHVTLRFLAAQRIENSPSAKARFLWLLVASLLLPVAATLSRQQEQERFRALDRALEATVQDAADSSTVE